MLAARRALARGLGRLVDAAPVEQQSGVLVSTLQPLACSTLVSLRSFCAGISRGSANVSPASDMEACSVRGASAATVAVAGGSGRGIATSAPAAAAEQQAASTAAAQQLSQEEESLEQIRARIFGYHVGNGQRSGRKVLRGALKGPRVMAWYPEDPTKLDPYMPDLEAERAKLKLDRLRRRGKAPPKKGQGKRSGKKK